MVTPPWEEPLPSCLIGGASIHQRRLKVLSEPCWIVTHHTALKPNLWWIPGDKVKTHGDALLLFYEYYNSLY